MEASEGGGHTMRFKYNPVEKSDLNLSLYVSHLQIFYLFI